MARRRELSVNSAFDDAAQQAAAADGAADRCYVGTDRVAVKNDGPPRYAPTLCSVGTTRRGSDDRNDPFGGV
jgi:hypothetical protein